MSRGILPAAYSNFPLAGGSVGKVQVGQCGGTGKALERYLKTKPSGALKGGDERPMDAIMMVKEREAMEVPSYDPPSWEPKGNLIPGSRSANVVASPCTTVKSLGDFFRCHLAAEVEKHAWAMTITAFSDYVAVGMKVEVHRDAAADSHTIVTFQHISQDDLVQFNHVCSLAIEYLSTRSLQVSELGGVRCPSPVLSDDDFDGDLFEFEEDWPLMLGSAFEAMSGLDKSMREQGVQALARWAERKADCIPALTDALIKHGSLVGELLDGPLAECYPLAVTLKFASCCPREAERLAQKILPLLPWPGSVPTSLVARELKETFRNLIPAAAAAGKGTFKAAEDLDELPELFEEDSASTCTGDAGCFSRNVSESSTSSMWESRKSSQGPQWLSETSETLVLDEEEGDFDGDFI